MLRAVRTSLFILLFWAMGTSAQAQRCHDDVLAEAASVLMLEGGDPTGTELVAAARRAGSDAPTVHALAIHDGSDARIASWLTRLEERLRAPIVCGQARGQERILVLAAPQAGRIETGEEGQLSFVLAAGFSEPTVFFEDARGTIERFELDGSRAPIPSHLEPPLRVQLVARGPDGPRPVAERTLGEANVATNPGMESSLEERIGALRSRAHASALRPHRLLASLAREHAERVCRVGHAAHELEPGRDPRARARERGLVARHIGEVVARGASVNAAFDALTRSASHRAALSDRRFTDAGAGIAEDSRGRVCVVVMLAAWPRLVAR